MDLHTIVEVKRPSSAEEIARWRDGYAWLGGGTWLFSEPQIKIDTLIDLAGLGWPALRASASGLDIAATCTIAELERFAPPADWTAGLLLRECCRALLASFKIWNAATVGGNICMSLPASSMVSLAVALDAVLTLWPRNAAPRDVRAADFVTGNHENILRPGELLRSLHVPAEALARTYAFRRASLTHLGRSTVLLIGTRSRKTGAMLLTVTAATARPVQLAFDRPPTAEQLRHALDAGIAQDLYWDDVHGSPAYRRHLTYHFGEEIRQELSR